MGETMELQRELLDLAERIDDFARRNTRLDLEETDGLPSIPALIDLIRELERINYEMMILHRKLSAMAGVIDRRLQRDFERVSTDLYAEDSIPAALVLLRALVQDKQSPNQDAVRVSRRYGELWINLSRAAGVVYKVAEAIKNAD